MITLVLLELVLLTKICKYIVSNATCTMCVACACGIRATKWVWLFTSYEISL